MWILLYNVIYAVLLGGNFCPFLLCFSNCVRLLSFAKDTKCWCHVVDPTLIRGYWSKTKCLTLGWRHPRMLWSGLKRKEYRITFALCGESLKLRSEAQTLATLALLSCWVLIHAKNSSSVLCSDINEKHGILVSWGKVKRRREPRRRVTGIRIRILSLDHMFPFCSFLLICKL